MARQEADPSVPAVTLNSRLTIATLLFAIMLCWPISIFGRPAYYEDTPSYYKGGRAAYQFVADRLTPVASARAAFATPQVSGPTDAIAEAKGVRSIPYSIALFAFAGPDATLVPLAILQALMLAFCAMVLLFAAGVGRVEIGAAAVGLAVATPAAWFACFASPDVFAGITLLVIATLAVFVNRLSRAVLAVLVTIGAFAVTAHAGNLALAIAITPVTLFAVATAGGAALRDRRTVLLTAAPLVAGAAIIVVGGLVGFGELSLAPKRYPLTLARSIGDGAARPYLERECRTPRYLVCQLYGTRLPDSGSEFIWGRNGIDARATPAQMERLRSEEWEIVTRAALRYPLLELRSVSRDTLNQLSSFGLTGVDFDWKFAVTGDGVRLQEEPRPAPGLKAVSEALVFGSTIASLAGLVLFYRRMSARQRAFVWLIVAGLLLNAAICAYFSAVANRYEARLIWLLPLAAIAMRPRRSAA